MSYPYRCTRRGCRQRVSLRHKKEWYVIERLCPSCGHDSLKLDRWKQRDHRRSRCICDGWWFPHRRGSLGCNHYVGARDINWEKMARELGASSSRIEAPGEPVPF